MPPRLHSAPVKEKGNRHLYGMRCFKTDVLPRVTLLIASGPQQAGRISRKVLATYTQYPMLLHFTDIERKRSESCSPIPSKRVALAPAGRPVSKNCRQAHD